MVYQTTISLNSPLIHWNSELLIRRDLRSLHSERCGRLRLCAAVVIFFVLIYSSYYLGTSTDPQMIVHIPPDDNISGYPAHVAVLSRVANSSPLPPVPTGYLVYGPGCQMPNLDPLAPDVMKLFHREKEQECSTKSPLTRIDMIGSRNASLVVDKDLLHKYDIYDTPHCCYREIRRSTKEEHADSAIVLSNCTHFQYSTILPDNSEFIYVNCSSKGGKEKYRNVHYIMREKHDVLERFERFKVKFEKKRPLSVLMMGIDSISRLNLIRAMPNTAQHIYNSGWFELKGYNKIDDNTYPNLMAILTGFNSSLSYSICDPVHVAKLDSCPMVWYSFRASGYVTGYAEDEAEISTFNFNKKGFLKPPTDYYLRPLMLAAEKHLPIKYKSSLKFCLGYQHSADYIYNYALDFAELYKDRAFFGLFWANTFSHNDISDPSSMDHKIKYYLNELDSRGILNTSAVILFSDHGLRFGPVRKLLTGWLEERLPFMFVWLPKWFQDENPEIVQTLRINRNRLTNPYDIHVTLHHVLALTALPEEEHITSAILPQATSCPSCQSVFDEVPWNRSCTDSAIEAHWCTCIPYKTTSRSSPIVKEAVKFIITFMKGEIDDYMNSTKATHKMCSDLHLKRIAIARKAEYRDIPNPHDDYLLVFETNPGGGEFESTVSYFLTDKTFQMTGSVSRLNSYASQSGCMPKSYLKKFCFCLKT
ncbi:uncharacterized protein LOC129800609 isoform X1 [Phlebotomus papatasi]|uniref:uncharacterized protein LOC129800609 isoform X1 n=1 Tax=Phlebotomus papatasi TaxID=29031 RepID=UPI0024836082|nr:uncharacterized protein LOC129800609 isoform X1 [Phlebotomus papatasi]